MMEESSTKPADMEAAQQLVQLSGGEEEESKGFDQKKKKEEEKKKKKEREVEGEDLSRAEISGKGKEEEMMEEEKHRLRKRKRFRSLASIYEVSKPMSNGPHGRRKKRLQRGKEKDI